MDIVEAFSEGVSFVDVGVKEKNNFPDPYILTAVKYHIRLGIDFTITIHNIQNDAQNNLVFLIPTISINNDVRVESIEWEYKNKFFI